jgi:hypothetical protein
MLSIHIFDVIFIIPSNKSLNTSSISNSEQMKMVNLIIHNIKKSLRPYIKIGIIKRNYIIYAGEVIENTESGLK